MKKVITDKNGNASCIDMTAEEVAAIEAQRLAEIEAKKYKSVIETKNGKVMIETIGDLSSAFYDEVAMATWNHTNRPIRVFMKNADYIAMLKVLPEFAIMAKDLALPIEQFDGGEFVYLVTLEPEHKETLLKYNAIIETKI